MTIFLVFVFCFPFLMLFYHLRTKKYLNPYKLVFVFGKKGSGKSMSFLSLGGDHHDGVP